MSITVEDMQSKLYGIDQLVEILEPTEDLSTLDVSMDGTKGITTFMLPPGWNIGLKAKDGQDLTDARIGIQGYEFFLTKDAILAMTTAVGLQQSYVAKTPGPMIQSHLNYWATHSIDQNLKVLAKDDKVLAVTKAGIKPFSNLELLDRALSQIKKKYTDVDDSMIYVDYKSTHDLNITNTRLVIPGECGRSFATSRSENDLWNGGVEIRNSLTGKTPLSVKGYLFAWECTNGAISQHNASKYNRKVMGQNEQEVYQWAADAVDKILGGFEHEFDTVQALVSENLESGMTAVLADIFRTYKVPLRIRSRVIEALMESKDETYYGVMQAITQAANDVENLSEHFITAILEIGGDLAHSATDRCVSCKRAI